MSRLFEPVLPPNESDADIHSDNRVDRSYADGGAMSPPYLKSAAQSRPPDVSPRSTILPSMAVAEIMSDSMPCSRAPKDTPMPSFDYTAPPPERV